MATWTSFYVQTADEQSLINALKSLSDIQQTTVAKFPHDLHDSFLIEKAPPNYLVVATTQPGWVTIVHNSASHLTDWCLQLSQQFNTQVIVTAAQSVSDYYYFALYEFGEKKRELEYCYSEDFEPVNVGTPFPFEQTGEDEEFFDFDSIDQYSQQLGLLIQRDYREYDWTILHKKTAIKTVRDSVAKLTKPWWKFWR